MAPKLRVAQPGEKKPRALTLTEAAQQGDHRDLLVALRDRIVTTIQASNCSPVALAALSRQCMLLSKEISMLDARAGDSIDPVTEAALMADEAWDASDL